jgi:hypothetical protein
MLDRVIGAFTFRSGVYKEVEEDTTFTTTAWILVIVVALLNQLGSNASRDVVGWLMGAVVGTIVTVIGFAVGAFVIQWVGRAVFKAEVTFSELVRTLGLAYVWNIVGFLGIVAVLSEALLCVVLPVGIVAWILGLIAWFVAAKEALDLEWVQTIVTVFLGWIVLMVITVVVGGVILGMLGLGAAGLSLLQGGF